MRPLDLLGLGTALPRFRIEQGEAAKAAVAQLVYQATPGQARLLPTLYRRTNVKHRASVVLEYSSGADYQQSFYRPAASAADRGPSTALRMQRFAEEAGPLARQAAEDALRDSGLARDQITHLVTVSCTGFFAPGIDITLMHDLPLRPTVQRTHVGFMGCHGALNGLRVAQALCAAEPGAAALLCAVELCSLHLSYGWDPDRIVANALFADGAAAAVVRASADPADGTSVDCWRVAATGSCLLPDSQDAMTWLIGDSGFEMTLSARVPNLIATHLRPWLSAWLDGQGIGLADVRSWAIHPGGPRIVDSVAESLGLSEAAVAVSNEVLAECGNMSSPTVLFILRRLREQDAPRPCVALGFGPGLVAEAALLT